MSTLPTARVSRTKKTALPPRSRRQGMLLVLFLCGLLIACGGGPSSPQNPTITSVTVADQGTQSMVRVGQSIGVVATVLGTGNYDPSVTWSVNGVKGGDAANGKISSQGLYTAPATLPSPNPVTITATSIADPTKSGSVTVPVFTLTITPSPVTVFYNHTQQFTATITGISNPTVTWFGGYGRITNTGLYSAPTLMLGQNVPDTISAQVTAGGPSVGANITLAVPPPVITSVTPASASANQTITLTGQDLYGLSTISFPGPLGSALTSSVSQSSLTGGIATVPLGAQSGTVTVLFTPTTGVTNTATFAFTRMPNIRIRAAEKDLSSGESEQFAYRFLGAGATPVTWSADMGTVNQSGLYQAPAVSQETFATVTACIVGSPSCDSTMLRILPMRVVPDGPTIGLGKTLQLGVQEGSSQLSANWSVLAGGGMIDPSGLYTAPTNPSQAGGIPVAASVGSTTASANIAVSGAFPGIVNRVYDYVNMNNQLFEGTYAQTVAVSGNRAYTIDQGIRFNPPFNANPPFDALEVYDISDPTHPVWLDAVETLSAAPFLMSTYSHYLFEADVATIANQPSRVAVYDLQNGSPALVSYAYTPEMWFACANDGVIYGTPADNKGSTAPIYVSDIRSGTVIQNEVDLSLPPGAVATAPPEHAIGAGNLLYADFELTNSAVMAVYDTSVSPPNLLGSTPITQMVSAGYNCLIANNLLYAGNDVFDISNTVPVEVAGLPMLDVESVSGTRAVGRGMKGTFLTSQNLKTVDVTNPATPIVRTNVFDEPSLVAQGHAELTGNYVLGTDGLGGLFVLDVSKPGGQIDKSRMGAFPGGYIFNHVVSQQMLYVAGENVFGQGGVHIFDLSAGTPAYLGGILYDLDAAYAVQLAGTHALLGMADSLKTIDVSNPSSPVETSSLALPTSALALSGSTLVDGTGDGRLVVLDVTNPNAPSTLGSVTLPAPAVNLRLAGSILFVADGQAGLLIFDVSNPAVPKQFSQFTLSTPVWDVAPLGSTAFLAADSAGLVVIDISNLLQPKQVSQTTLESYSPFHYNQSVGPRSVALSVAVQNGIVYVGTANSLGLVFGFDYSQVSNPRLVLMSPFGEFIDSLISGFAFLGTDIYVIGSLDEDSGFVQSDNTSPRNVIDLYYPPLALRDNTFTARARNKSVRNFVHPKFDRNFLKRRKKPAKTLPSPRKMWP